MGMFFWLIVLFMIAWGLLDYEMGLLRDKQAAQEMSRPIARKPALAPPPEPVVATPAGDTQAAPVAPPVDPRTAAPDVAATVPEAERPRPP